MPVFSSKILSYPKEVITKLDELIASGKNPDEIKNYITEYFLKEVNNKPPDMLTVQRYVEWKATTLPAVKNSISTELANLEATPEKPMDIEVLKTKKETLENLIQLCHDRLRKIDRKTKNAMDPRWESHMRSYIEEARHLIETLAKLSGELSEESNIVINVVQMELVKFFKIIQEIVLEVCPDKASLFKEKMKEKFKLMQESPVEGNDSREDKNEQNIS